MLAHAMRLTPAEAASSPTVQRVRSDPIDVVRLNLLHHDIAVLAAADNRPDYALTRRIFAVWTCACLHLQDVTEKMVADVDFQLFRHEARRCGVSGSAIAQRGCSRLADKETTCLAVIAGHCIVDFNATSVLPGRMLKEIIRRVVRAAAPEVSASVIMGAGNRADTIASLRFMGANLAKNTAVTLTRVEHERLRTIGYLGEDPDDPDCDVTNFCRAFSIEAGLYEE